jgi:thiamine-monophosphate kinase
MVDNEFDIIDKYFLNIGWQEANSVILGPGDDCAVLSVPPGQELCVSTDTLVEGVHFPLDCTGSIVATRSFAASVSDLAAMGAEPYAFTGALTMPRVDHDWLSDFSRQLSSLSIEYQIPLVGGNLSRGPLSLTFTVMGLTPVGQAIQRSGAAPGDDVYVTGYPGEAGAGLLLSAAKTGEFSSLLNAYHSPRPRIEVGLALRSHASAAIDISDGLLADLNHLTDSSDSGAEIDVSSIPLSRTLLDYTSREKALLLACTAGDDYELCFSAPDRQRSEIESISIATGIRITRIGRIVEGQGVKLTGDISDLPEISKMGYQHF